MHSVDNFLVFFVIFLVLCCDSLPICLAIIFIRNLSTCTESSSGHDTQNRGWHPLLSRHLRQWTASEFLAKLPEGVLSDQAARSLSKELLLYVTLLIDLFQLAPLIKRVQLG